MVDRINELAKKTGVSISTIEKAVGLSNGIIGKWKKQSPSCDKLKLVADYLNVSVDYLLTGEERISSRATADEQEQAKERLPIADRSINFSTDTDFTNATLYNVTGDDAKISPTVPEASAKEYEKFSNIIEHIQSLSEREQWKAIFRLENILKEEYPIDSVKKTIKKTHITTFFNKW